MHTFLLLTLAMFSAPFEEAPQSVDITLPDGPHPCVFLTNKEVSEVRERAESLEWAQKVAQGILKEADALVEAPLEIPREGGQWSHWYTCKECGGGLKAESPTRHVCKVCGKVYSGFPYDQVYIKHQHVKWLKGLSTLGTAYVLDPKPAYAQRARDILVEYASFYEDLPRHDRNNKDSLSGAKLFAQTLNAGVMLCSIGMGYDFVYEAPCFSKEDHALIADHFLRPMVALLKTHRSEKSNWQSWRNAGIATAGFVLRDAEMLEFAINNPNTGFLNQMRVSVLPSGMWYEGAPSYHWYAFSAHIYLLEGATRAGINLYTIPAVKAMFDAPPNQLFPDRTFPAINDSTRSSIKSARRFYEVAYRHYGDPNYLALREPRNTEWGLLWGKEAPADTEVPELELATTNDPDAGLAVLRNNPRNMALFFNYSLQTCGHVQPAKLDIILYANGDQRIVDPGRLSYGNPLHRGWYRQTIAHNTVVVNETSQRNASCIFKEFESTSGWSLARASLDKAYDGVVLDRMLFLRDNAIVDVYRCTAEEESVFDLTLHFLGELEELPAGQSLEAFPVIRTEKPGNGYQHLRNVAKLESCPETFSVDTGNGTAIHVTVLDISQVYTAEGRAQPPSRYDPAIIRRQTGKKADFVTVYQVLGKDESPIPIDGGIGETVRVALDDTTVLVGRAATQIRIGEEIAYGK
ncbi:MAG: heparinase II/III family protein [Candidatus Hydrogenedentota bacterium]